MLNALEARARIEEPKAAAIKKEVETKIEEAVERGNDFCRVETYLPDSVEVWLKSLNYKVQRFKPARSVDEGHTMIYW